MEFLKQVIINELELFVGIELITQGFYQKNLGKIKHNNKNGG